MSKFLGQKEFGELLGLSTRQIGNLTKAGMPVEANGRHPRYPVPQCVQWYVRWKEKAAADRAAPADYDTAKARREAALAEQEELKLAKMRDELMTVEDFRRLCHDKDARVAARLKSLPQKLAPAVVGVREVNEGLTRVRPLVDELMDELYRANDVPEAEEAA